MECRSLRDSGQVLKKFKATYFMASTDSLDDVTAFAKKNDANFPILADPTRSASAAYGVLSDRGYAKRWTFYINPEGIISKIDRSVSPATAGPDLAKHLAELGFPTRNFDSASQ